jgi:serine/threonine protein kinase/Tol biopolymer transport system component
MTEPARLAAALADRYRIERELGAGGMATVYLAEDLKHDRKVAVKVLRPELAAAIGAERFLAEIRTTANLQHPHILPLFDSGTADSFLFYVMPFVDGESLRDRLSRETQLPVNDAVRIASEVAGALDYAHRHGVIHRDIKPENILLHDGRALVADFGIALAASRAGGSRMTETGMSLGTPHYMSPEQAMGERKLTPRSDIFALGAVTYEMLAGDPPFSGTSAQAIVARMLAESPPPLRTPRPSVPPALEAAVMKALERVPADRFATAADFASALTGGHLSPVRSPASPLTRLSPRIWSMAAIAAAGLLGLGALGHRFASRSPGGLGVVRATLELGDSVSVRPIANSRLAIAPSGRRIAFIGSEGDDAALWVRDLDQPVARRLPDTRGAFAPFFSPDGQSIGFFTGVSPTSIKVVPAAGGPVRTVVRDVASGFGADWADDGRIYFSHVSRGLARVSADGGAVTVLTRPDSATGFKEHDYPDVLPGSGHAVVLLFTGSIETNRIGLINLRTGGLSELIDGSIARFLPPGLLVVGGAEGRLLAAPFDAREGRLTGTPVLVQSDVEHDIAAGTVEFAVADNGTLVYQRRSASNVGIVWVDRSGGITPVDSTLREGFVDLVLSPDGTRLAVSLSPGEVWIKHLVTGAFSRISLDLKDAQRPAWTPEGREVAFIASRNGRQTTWIRRADGSDGARAAVGGTEIYDEISFDPKGRFTLLRSLGTTPGTRHLLILEHGVDTIPRILLRSPYDAYGMTLSPDGRWLAYVSEESGTPEISVRPFPNVDSARFAISSGGGIEPLWRRDGRELFYRTTRGEVYATAISAGPGFQHGAPVRLFSLPYLVFQQYHRTWDIHPDGRRFLMLRTGGTAAQVLNVVFNWQESARTAQRGGAE